MERKLNRNTDCFQFRLDVVHTRFDVTFLLFVLYLKAEGTLCSP